MLSRLIDHPTEPVTFAFEDDGRVAYAYLHRRSGEDAPVVADVWLYNRASTPQQLEWTSRDNLPFRNSADFVRSDEPIDLPRAEEDIDIAWLIGPLGKIGGRVLLRDVVIGELYEGDKPGRALLAQKDGPLAKTLPR